MKRSVKALLAASIAVGFGASVFFVPSATSNPFGGSDPSSCGAGQDCASATFTASAATGPVFSVASQLTCAVDFGPGAADCVGTNGSGYIKFSDSAVIDVGSTRIQSSQVVVTGGAITCDAACEIRDSGNGTLPINTTGGVVFNGTSAMTGFVLLAVTVDVGNITALTCLDVTATVAGVEANDGVFVTRNFASTANYSVSDAYVTNAGTDEVTFRACNVTALDINPASGSYLFWAVRKA